MHGELLEIRDFLAAHPPFDRLPAEALERLPRQLAIRYLRRGTPLGVLQGDDAVLIRKGSLEFRDNEGNLLEKLAEGDLHPAPCLEAEATTPGNGVFSEDTLLYLIPCARLAALREAHAAFDRHFERSLRQRLQHAITTLQKRGGELPPSSLTLAELLLRPAVTLACSATIREAAAHMSAEGVSALLLTEAEALVGILTDRDLRQRCLAVGLDPATPVREIMTARPMSLTPDSSAYLAMQTMARHHVHHLPVEGRDGSLLGVITPSDILQRHHMNVLTLHAAIRHASNVEALANIAAQLPELQLQLTVGGLAQQPLYQSLTGVADAIAERLLQMAEEALGPPPVPYAWLVCGSQARGEMGALADQDNALLLDDAVAESHLPYFEQLARFVCDGLARCGYTSCPGGVMATTPEWRQPLKVWRRYFERWISNPEPKALMHASIFFDMRALRDTAGLLPPLREALLARCRQNTLFIAHLSGNALKHRPPLGFFRQFVLVHDGEHDDSLDIKHRGIIPLVDLARIFALSAGNPELGTLERLQAAELAGVLSHEGSEDLQHAFTYIATLRLHYQAEQRRRGEAMDNFLAPADLSHLEQAQLKDAFGVIRDMQSTLSQRYHGGRLT